MAAKTPTRALAMVGCSALAAILALAGMIDTHMYTYPTDGSTGITISVGIWTQTVVALTRTTSSDVSCSGISAGCTGGAICDCLNSAARRCSTNQAFSVIGFISGFAGLVLCINAAKDGPAPPAVPAAVWAWLPAAFNGVAAFCYFVVWAIAISMVEGSASTLSSNCAYRTTSSLGGSFVCILFASFAFCAATMLAVLLKKSAYASI